MASMFYVLSLLLYAKARLANTARGKGVLFAGCVFAGMMALGSKEMAATLPFFIVLYEWYFFQETSRTWFKRHLFHGAVLLVFFLFVAFLFLGAHPFKKIFSEYHNWDFDLTQRVLTEFRVVFFYISLFIFPHPSRLNLDHDFPLSHSLVDPITTLLSLAVIIGLLVLAIYLSKKEPLISFPILWFLGNLAIESSVIPLDIVFEHRMYLPSMFVSLIIVIVVERYVRPKWLKLSLLCTMVALCALWTYERNSVWSDDVTLFRDSLEKSPNKARPHHELGAALAEQGKTAEAIKHFSAALQIKPDHALAHANLATALALQGKTAEAIRHFSEALRFKPRFKEAHFNLANALIRMGRFEEAIDHLQKALRIAPSFDQARDKLAKASAALGIIDKTITEKQQALERSPGNPALHCDLGFLYKTKGELDKAIDQYQKALSIRPQFARALSELALVFEIKGEYGKALSFLQKLTRHRQHQGQVYFYMARVYARQNKVGQSINWLKKSVGEGFRDWKLLKKDNGFYNIKRSKYYRELIRNH
jgi:tetratricopeptide (TPR) repeat protein